MLAKNNLQIIGDIIKSVSDDAFGVADRPSIDEVLEHMLCSRIAALHPEARFFAEEAYKEDQTLTRYLDDDGDTYIIDPIDNTTAFLEDTSTVYAVMVAKLHKGQLVAGWMYYPALGLMLTGAMGQGAFMNGLQLENPHITDAIQSSPKAASLTLNIAPHSARSIRSIADALDRYKQNFPRINERRAVCEHALDLLVHKTGDIYINRVPWPWDTAAFYSIYRAWGGQIAFPDGGATDIHQIHKIGQILAPNQAMLETAFRAAQECWPALKQYNDDPKMKGLSWGAPPAVPQRG